MAERLVSLGDCQETDTGEEYEATLRGTAWITSEHDYGEFLSDRSYAEAHPVDPVTGVGLGMQRRKQLTITDLFPPEWREVRVEYEISVRARKLAP